MWLLRQLVGKLKDMALNSMRGKSGGQQLPLIVVLGATGSGKSKLALEIAEKYGGEIISADSMQVYRELNITTNKVTAEEMQRVSHHLIDFVDPLSRLTVVDFRNRALPVINNLLDNNRLPVIVGGTNYYIESLIWNVLLFPEAAPDDSLLFDNDDRVLQNSPREDANDEDNLTKETIFRTPIVPESFTQTSSELLHRVLAQVDFQAAIRLHPNNKRKIIRCLQIYQQQGRSYTEIVSEQKALDGASSLGGPLRFPNCLIFWLQCNQTVLDKRLDGRVDVMIEQGLIKELLDFHQTYNKHRLKHNLEADYTKGIFQSIGFKEFHSFLILPEEERLKADALFKECVDKMKLVTRRYSRKQIKWIRNRFLASADRTVPPVFGLNATDPSRWKSNVNKPALEIVEAHLKGAGLPSHLAPLSRAMRDPSALDAKATFYCEDCKKVIQGTVTWKLHLSSRKHQKHVKSLKRRLESEAEAETDAEPKAVKQ